MDQVTSGESAGVEGFAAPDPAERRALNRLFYRDRRPTWLGHWVSQFFCWSARLGLTPQSWVALRVRDRVSGRMRQDAVVIPTSSGRKHFPLPVGAPLAEFAAIASEYPVYRIEVPPR